MADGIVRASRRGLADNKGLSDKYNTPIPPDKKQDFERWVEKIDIQRGKEGRGSILNDKYDYDIQGAFLAGEGPDMKGHFTDKFKKPNHPTFSDESIYHGPSTGFYGGKWKGDKFIPRKKKGD